MVKRMASNSTIKSVKSLKNQRVIADQCEVKVRFFERAFGLIGRKEFRIGQALWFPNCRDIHMYFMSIPIDVIFMKKDHAQNGIYHVSSVRKGIRPWSPLPYFDFSATDVIELPKGAVEAFEISPGDALCIS